jgi:peptidoglycan/xylan/chitin deacetylase (PgdA/CDA1 family)
MRERFAYAPIAGRPPLRWPEGKRLAVWVVPNVEHYEFQPSVLGVRNPWPRTAPPDALYYPLKEYGNRVGIDRLLDVTDRLGVTCTVSLSLAVPVMFPDVFAEMQRRGWEFMCHGLYNTHYLWDCPLEDEREFVFDCVRRTLAATGEPIHGWFSPACSHTVHTPDLVAEAGIGYYCDLYHDDQPFPVRTASGSLISIPYSMDVNDVVVQIGGGDADAFANAIVDQFKTLYEESRHTGLVMCIACHPYVTGQPHRIASFERALRHVLAHDDVWMTTGSQIARWYRARHLDQMLAWLAEQR